MTDKERLTKYRAKSPVTGEWMYGYPIIAHGEIHLISEKLLEKDKHDIQTILHKSTLIEEGTLNRFTGFVDREGREIYENDEVKDLRKDTFIVTYNDYFGAWELSRGTITIAVDKHYCETFLKVIGNSYETYTKYQETYIN